MERSPDPHGQDVPSQPSEEPMSGAEEQEIDRILADSFPASDPPCNTWCHVDGHEAPVHDGFPYETLPRLLSLRPRSPIPRRVEDHRGFGS